MAFTIPCPQCHERGQDADLTFHVYRDSEGDAGVVNGLNHFTVAELESQDCKCELTESEMDTLLDKAAAEGGDSGAEWFDHLV